MYELPPIDALPKAVREAAEATQRAARILADADTAAADAYVRNERREADFLARLNAAVAEGKPHTDVVDDRAQREADAIAAEAHKQVARRQADAAWVTLRREIAANAAAVDALDAAVESAAADYLATVERLEAQRARYAEALGIRSWWASATLQPANPRMEPRLAPYRPAPAAEVSYNASNAGMATKRGNFTDAVKVLRADAAGLDVLRAREAKAQTRADHEARAAAMRAAQRADFEAQEERARHARAARLTGAD